MSPQGASDGAGRESPGQSCPQVFSKAGKSPHEHAASAQTRNSSVVSGSCGDESLFILLLCCVVRANKKEKYLIFFFLIPHSDGRNKPAGEAVTALQNVSALMEVQGNSGVGPAEGLLFPLQVKEVNWESVCRLELSFDPAAGGIQSLDVGKVRQL